MPGLDPGIQESTTGLSKEDVDGWVKPGHDDNKVLFGNAITKR
jgi:hypothetical protein